jgi:NADP oxidoreductase coenzyme F420-dependent
MSLEPAYATADSKDRMGIGIVGAGRIGHGLAVRSGAVRHEVMLSNSRGPDTLAEVLASIGGNVRAGTVAEAARFGDVVAVAIPPPAIRDLPPAPFAGKVRWARIPRPSARGCIGLRSRASPRAWCATC